MVADPPRQRSTGLRGAALLNDPLLNKGTAFSRAERQALGLEALLPWQVETIEAQVERCWQAFGAMGSDLERYAYLQTLRERNVTLFHRVLAGHIEAVMPVVYTPTVGLAIQSFSHTYRSPSQGIYLAAPQQHQLEELLAQACAASGGGPPQLLLVTDAQGILGIGDQGVGGIQICQGKLAVYTLCAGLDPARGLPVMLDVGTDRSELLADPCYPGLRQPRLQGEAYTAFLDRFIDAVERVCPGALVHWEDFGAAHARPVLEAYRQRVPSFNDDIQGTSGVAAAAILAGLRGLGQRLVDQRIVIFGAGSAGCGIAERLWRLLQRQGLSAAAAADRLWLIDRDGLLHSGSPGMGEGARPFAKSAEVLREHFGTPTAPSGAGFGLQAVIEAVQPGVLIGTSTAAGAFDQAVVEALCRGCERPIVLPLSNPTRLAEITPANLLLWSHGRALVATGSPFGPVASADPEGRPRERVIGQCNNCFVFPGLGYGAVAVGATEVSEAMIDASIEALARVIPAAADPDAPLMPPLAAVQEVSRAVAEAVALAAVAEGLARLAATPEQALERLEACRWSPEYPALQAATPASAD
ncbi:NAD-dependent malic enzyme [Synechococcus sp. CCY 9618]|uniref:NAD-dependent malic enzyme n=1 Tax=Synechococcus sp. CCY 9618 TaxID=2815602 RepID=UPI001C239F87